MLDETICYLCDRQFIGKNEFESHVSDVHAKIIKEDKCELCDKSFSDKHSLASPSRCQKKPRLPSISFSWLGNEKTT